MSGLRYVQVGKNLDGTDGMLSIELDSDVVPIEEMGKELPGLGALMRLYAPMEFSPIGIYELFRSTLLRLDKPQSIARLTLKTVLESRNKHGIYPGLPAQWFSLEMATNSMRVMTVDEMRKAADAWSVVKGPRVGNLGALFIETYGTWQETEKALKQITDDIKKADKLLPDTETEINVVEQVVEPWPAAVMKRDELLSLGWPTSADVGAQLGSGAGNAAQYASQLRKQGRLFGVWSAKDGAFRHPNFQFDGLGQLRPQVAELLALIDDEDDTGGWRRAFWLYGGSDELEGKTPAEMFETDPGRVIALAMREKEAKENPHGNY